MKHLGRFAAGLFATAILAGLAIGASGAEHARHFLQTGGPICPLLALTGLPCPFCGMTRATIAIGAGEWDRAFALHPLAPFVLVASFVVAASIAVGRDRWLRARWAPPSVLSAIGLVWIAKLVTLAA
ncbi:MAG: DUF2752 domain-containing protein [Myxococcota bacterium]|nr:DUF2752 domain-containing protein [Deltaproteobacteria bacterium]MDQ3339513.1 DUF2752 domain-containing protein [Myxococcota bacterium]